MQIAIAWARYMLLLILRYLRKYNECLRLKQSDCFQDNNSLDSFPYLLSAHRSKFDGLSFRRWRCQRIEPFGNVNRGRMFLVE